MPRRARLILGDYAYHVLNRSSGAKLFLKEEALPHSSASGTRSSSVCRCGSSGTASCPITGTWWYDLRTAWITRSRTFALADSLVSSPERWHAHYQALPFFGASIPGFVGLLTGRGPFSPAFALIPGRSVSSTLARATVRPPPSRTQMRHFTRVELHAH